MIRGRGRTSKGTAMGSRLRKALLGIVALQVVAWAIGQVIAKRLSRGDERSDEFQVAAIYGGKKFHSQADRLRSGSVVATMGGVELDLRDATLDPTGATLDVNATMGGVQITVPDDWLVDIADSGIARGVDAKVTAPEDLPPDAPTLHVHAVLHMSGTQV